MWIAVAALLAALSPGALPPTAASLDAPMPLTGRCPDGRIWTTSTAEQGDMLALVNQARDERRRPRLARVAALDRMALAHAADMACGNYFSHRNRQREKLSERFTRAAGADVADWTRLAEVLGTSPTALRQVEQWLRSRSHRAAMLERQHAAAGVGMVRIGRGSRYVTYWAVEFAGR
ncbi:MAG: CAP domain-containing protein [Vicinamibacterales bacterium]